MKESIKNEKKKQKKHREIYLVLLLLLGISVGFSYLTSQLDIIGNTTIKKQSWNVHFDTPVVDQNATVDGGSRKVKDRGTVALKNGSTLEVDFTANLEYPGDYFEFTVPVKNAGTIDAMIAENGITNTATTNDLISYTVEYADGTDAATKTIAAKDGLHNGKNNVIKVRIEYKKDVTNDQVNNMAAGGITINSTYSMTFVQADGTANYKTFERANS